jgi:hypothetical protein
MCQTAATCKIGMWTPQDTVLGGEMGRSMLRPYGNWAPSCGLGGYGIGLVCVDAEVFDGVLHGGFADQAILC